jgi:hypothetical protein
MRRVQLEDLAARQRFSLWLDGRAGLATLGETARFLADVGIALRYGPSSDPAIGEYVARDHSVRCVGRGREGGADAPVRADQSVPSQRQAIEVNLVANRLALLSPGLLSPGCATRRARRSRSSPATSTPAAATSLGT